MAKYDVELKYTSNYEDLQIRGSEDPRPWNISEEVLSYSKLSHKLLDIGCGTCTKLLPIVGQIAEAWGVEPSESMRRKADANMRENRISNLHIVDGVAESLPFPDQYFDLVTAFVAPHVTEEVHRVLKPGGHAIIEKIGDRDKANIKELFGADRDGPRGYLLGMKAGERERTYHEEFTALFHQVSVRVGRWKTYYSREGLLRLCQEAKTVRDFDPHKDQAVLDAAVARFSTERGIETWQERILIVAEK